MSKVAARREKSSGMYKGTSGIRIHGHGPLGAENQDPNFGPENRALYGRTEHKKPIFKISPRGLIHGFRVEGVEFRPGFGV